MENDSNLSVGSHDPKTLTRRHSVQNFLEDLGNGGSKKQKETVSSLSATPGRLTNQTSLTTNTPPGILLVT